MKSTPIGEIAFGGWNLALKLEGFDVNRSHKARAAAHAIARLRQSGFIRELGAEKVKLVISSSGNAAHEIAKLTAGTNVELQVFTDVLSPIELADRLKGWPHARVVVIDEPDASGSHATARKRALREYRQKNPDAVELDQYLHSDWPCGYHSLFVEIEQQVPNVGAILVPVGTAATARAAAQFKIYHQRRWKIYAIDAAGSALNGTPIGKRLFSGYGNGAETEWARQARPHMEKWLRVPDQAVVRAARWARARGHFLGASSAAALAGAAHLIECDCLPHGGTVVVICPDSGVNYRTTLYSDTFLRRNGLGHLAEPDAA